MNKYLQLTLLFLLLSVAKSWAIVGDSCNNPIVANLCGGNTFTTLTDSFRNNVKFWKVNGNSIYAAYGQDIYYQINLPSNSYKTVSLSASLSGHFPCNCSNRTIYFLWFEGSPCSSNPVAVSYYNIGGTTSTNDSIFTSYQVKNSKLTYYLVITFDLNNYPTFGYNYNLQLGFSNNQVSIPVCSPGQKPYKGQVLLDNSGGCYTTANPYKLPLSVLNDIPDDPNVFYPKKVGTGLTNLPLGDDNSNGFVVSIKTTDYVNNIENYQWFDNFPYTYTGYGSNFGYNVAFTLFLKNTGVSGIKGFRMRVSQSYSSDTIPGFKGTYDTSGTWQVTYNKATNTRTWLFNGKGGRGDNTDTTGYTCKVYTFDAPYNAMGDLIEAWYLPDNYGNDSLSCIDTTLRADCQLYPTLFERGWVPITLHYGGTPPYRYNDPITGHSCFAYTEINNGVFEPCIPNFNQYDYNGVSSTVTYDSSGCAAETDSEYNIENPGIAFNYYDFDVNTTNEVDTLSCSKPYRLVLYNSYYGRLSTLVYLDTNTGTYHPVDSLGNILYNEDYDKLTLPNDLPVYPYPLKSFVDTFTIPLTVSGTYTIFNLVEDDIYTSSDDQYKTYYSKADCQPGKLVLTINDAKITLDPPIDSIPLCHGDGLFVDMDGNDFNFQWFPDSSVENYSNYQYAVLSPTVTTTYTVIGTNDAGCSDTETYVVYVSLCPPSSYFGFNLSGCSSNCGYFNDFSYAAINWQWSFPGGTPSSYIGQYPPQVCYPAKGYYTVKQVVSNSAGSDSTTQIIEVGSCNVIPILGASDSTICSGDCTTFNNLTPVNVNNLKWSFPGGNPSSYISSGLGGSVKVCYADTGVYAARLIAVGFGSDTTYLPVHVKSCNNSVTAAFTAVDSLCAKGCLSITNNSTGNITTWSWNFPGGNPSVFNGQNPPNFCYNTAGTYTAVLIVSNGSNSDTAYHTIVINDCLPPQASFAGKDSICPGDCITFINTSSKNATQLYWLFDGGNPSNYTGQNPPVVCFTGLGNHTILLIASNNYGSDTAYHTIVINNCSVPLASFTGKDSICPGDCIAFTNTSTANATQWQWLFNGGVPSSFIGQTPPNICYNTVGNDIARLIASNNYGSDTAYQTITVFKYSAGGLTAYPDTICEGNDVAIGLSNSYGNVQWQIATVLPQFTDISGVTDIGYQSGPLNQTIYVRVVAGNNNCADTSGIIKVTVLPPDPVSFKIASINGLNASFVAIDTSGNAIKFSWNFGDGDTSSQMNPVHSYKLPDTTYNVCLTAYDRQNCSYTICQLEYIHSSGVKSITVNDNIQVYPDPFSDYLLIKAGAPGIKSVELYDMLGRELMNKDVIDPQAITVRLDAANLIDGMYYLRIRTVNGTYIQNVVKARN